MKTVAIVGSSRKTRHLAPFDDGSADIWGFNEALAFPWMKRATAMFQMHPRWVFARSGNHNDQHHLEWLQQDHQFPIYMLERHLDIPASVEYPIEEVISRFCPARKFFTSTIPYAIALAMLYEYDRIELYGVDQSSESEYFWERDCTSYWIGKAEGLGIDVYLPDDCSLLAGRLYGYEGGKVIERMRFEVQLNALLTAEQETLAELHVHEGRVKLLAQQLESSEGNKDEIAQQFSDALADERTTLIRLSRLQGARVENERYLAECDALLRAAGDFERIKGEYVLAEEVR